MTRCQTAEPPFYDILELVFKGHFGSVQLLDDKPNTFYKSTGKIQNRARIESLEDYSLGGSYSNSTSSIKFFYFLGKLAFYSYTYLLRLISILPMLSTTIYSISPS
jgi:hypothetical protein